MWVFLKFPLSELTMRFTYPLLLVQVTQVLKLPIITCICLIVKLVRQKPFPFLTLSSLCMLLWWCFSKKHVSRIVNEEAELQFCQKQSGFGLSHTCGQSPEVCNPELLQFFNPGSCPANSLTQPVENVLLNPPQWLFAIVWINFFSSSSGMAGDKPRLPSERHCTKGHRRAALGPHTAEQNQLLRNLEDKV